MASRYCFLTIYRLWRLTSHADKHGHSTEAAKKAEDMFKEVGEAFSVLSDPKKRQRYLSFPPYVP